MNIIGPVNMDLVVTFNGETRSVEVNGEKAVLGRKSRSQKPDVDLNPDKSVSRRHAMIWAEGRKFWIEDLGSTLGTYVNGLRRPKFEVRFGDKIHVGKTMIQLMPSKLSEMGTG